ncbi:MAG: HEAT repeat domain-containing protein [Phycisphaerales bacterium]|nr:HEAT repeat domain-containing protein [Phycisphaerales bacterium]
MRHRECNSSSGEGVRWWRVRGLAFAGLLGVVAISDVACISAGDSYRAGIQAERPTDRIRAIYKAGELRDPLAVALLVDRLEDEDSGVRLYAFLALERITGKRCSYDYAALPSARAQAVDRWRSFVRERYAAGAPATVGSDGGVADKAMASP